MLFHDGQARLRPSKRLQNMGVIKHMAMDPDRNPRDKRGLRVRHEFANLDPGNLESLTLGIDGDLIVSTSFLCPIARERLTLWQLSNNSPAI